MTSALSAPPRDPQQCLDLFLQAALWLRGDGVVIRYDDIPTGRSAEWKHATRTLLLKPNSPIRHQVWTMVDLISYLEFGIAGTSAHREIVRLHLVPDQRAEADPLLP